jgi:XTP/dITP diphosphohydrolase
LEEAYEAAEAIEAGSREAMREELGDVLLQVVFHAVIASEDAADPFGLDDLARGVAEKLVRRHPHVFAADGTEGLSAEESYRRWDQVKAVEKSRASVLDGIPAAQSPLARAQKVFGRARRAGLEVRPVPDAVRPASPDLPPTEAAAVGDLTASDLGASKPTGGELGSWLGERLAGLAAVADAAGLDAEQELRAATRRVEARIRRIETEQAMREESKC